MGVGPGVGNRNDSEPGDPGMGFCAPRRDHSVQVRRHANQLGRRNLTPDQRSILRGRRYNRMKGRAGRQPETRYGSPEWKNFPFGTDRRKPGQAIRRYRTHYQDRRQTGGGTTGRRRPTGASRRLMCDVVRLDRVERGPGAAARFRKERGPATVHAGGPAGAAGAGVEDLRVRGWAVSAPAVGFWHGRAAAPDRAAQSKPLNGS